MFERLTSRAHAQAGTIERSRGIRTEMVHRNEENIYIARAGFYAAARSFGGSFSMVVPLSMNSRCAFCS